MMEKQQTRPPWAQRIDELVREKGWSHAEFARRLELDRSQLWHMLSGERRMRPWHKTHLAKVLGVPASEIFEEE